MEKQREETYAIPLCFNKLIIDEMFMEKRLGILFLLVKC